MMACVHRVEIGSINGVCHFREVCAKSPQVRKQWLEAKFKKDKRWNPLRIR